MFRTHYAALCSFAYPYVRSAEAAEDIVQEVFSALWAARGTMKITTSVRAYLYAAVRNRALNMRKHEAVAEEWARHEADDDVRALHPTPVQPDEILDRVQRESELRTALDALPERCRLVMRLRWQDQLSYAEIAEAMGISIKGVEKQLARGLQSLRDRLV
jgi:RNA polymerase sigma-70 factor (ECF subfamily)